MCIAKSTTNERASASCPPALHIPIQRAPGEPEHLADMRDGVLLAIVELEK